MLRIRLNPDHNSAPHHSRLQSPSFLGHVVLKQIKPSGSGDENSAHKTAWTLRRVEVWDIVTLLKFHGNRCWYSKDSCDKRRLFFVTRQVFPFLLFTIKYDYTEINSFMSALSTRIVLDDSICSFRYLRDRYLDHDATCYICCKWNSNLCNGSLTKYTTGILEEINWCFCWIVILGTFYWFCSLC